MTNNHQSPIFRFSLLAAELDPTGYYHTRWHRAHPITVVATTKAEAIKKAEACLGECVAGFVWQMRVVNIEEVYNEAVD